ncbi:MAG TPA: DUF2092 domain-containing protein [Acetobacteraceae bacterium]|nr:DUF2092 domain-containing protein [Acetobacteraceae bacterium]
MQIAKLRSVLHAWQVPTACLLLVFSATVAAQAQPQNAKNAKPPAPAAAKNRPAAPTKMVLESKAMDLLKATSERLAAAKSMTFTAVASYEFPSQLGPPILYTVRYDVAMQRPDKLRVVIPGDGPVSEFYYDGKTMMAYAPAENLVAVADAPPTIDAALKAAFVNADIFYPFTDLLVADPYVAMTNGAILAFYIGPSGEVGGVKTEMLAWANPDVFLQIWIGADDKLPRRVRAVYSADPLNMRHQLDISNWQLDPVLPADTFTSEKARSAEPMKFARPANAAPAGMKPIGMTRPSKATPTQPAAKTP